jgi:pimeloyl-ACP methyl ester carboxylesterase
MAMNDATVVLVHGAWADGSSWAKVIAPLAASGVSLVTAPSYVLDIIREAIGEVVKG